MSVTVGVMLSQKEGGVARVVKEVDDTLYAPDMDGDRICAFLDGAAWTRAPRC